MIVAHLHTEEELQRSAKTIAEAIQRMSVDQRGDLLAKVAEILKDNMQGYTGVLIKAIAEKYGISGIRA